MRIVLERVGLVGAISLNRRLYLGFPFRLLRIYAAQDGTINRSVGPGTAQGSRQSRQVQGSLRGLIATLPATRFMYLR